ncbi:two-component sensor histidine kinase [Inquilinus ginsengisoli]|uniref:hypothetical protein n=1 Tax=Inquilinus ginsengisoli TaxID=363840 RepID=UPI003D24063E
MTNAGKYGALSVAEGQVTVTWAQHQNERRLDWTETGGPVPAAPATPGFGLKLDDREAEHALGGKAELNFAHEGLIATLRFEVE